MEIWRYENLCSFTILAPKVVEYNVTSTPHYLDCAPSKMVIIHQSLPEQNRKNENRKIN